MTKSKTFNPKEHLIDIKGKEYLPVAWRIVWFRESHPDWTIETRMIDWDKDKMYCVFQAKIYDKERLIATGTKSESKQGFKDYIEKAETGSIGRALAYCGYGTQFEPELNEKERLADAPQ